MRKIWCANLGCQAEATRVVQFTSHSWAEYCRAHVPMKYRGKERKIDETYNPQTGHFTDEQ